MVTNILLNSWPAYESYRSSGAADADQHYGTALWAGAGISRAQRLGPVDPRRS